MIAYPLSLKAVGGAHTGIAPVSLLDVLDTNGNAYYWSDRSCSAPNVITNSALYPVPTPPRSLAGSESVAYSYGLRIAFAGSFSDGAHIYRGAGSSSISSFPSIPASAVITGLFCGLLGSVVDDGGWTEISFPGEVNTSTFSGSLWAADVKGAIGAPTVPNAEIYLMGESAPTWNAEGGGGNISFEGSLAINLVPIVAIYFTVPAGILIASPSPLISTIYGGPYLPWILEVPEFKTYRSLQTDTGSFVLQNLGGDTLSRDFEKIMRRSALEGALFIYRLWQADAQASWLEIHGTLTVADIGVDTVKLKGTQLLNPAQDDTPLEQYSETCQLQWGGRRCGATGSTECSYSLQTCQSPNRIMVEQNNYEKNFGEAAANTAFNVINRRRTI